MLKKVYIFTSRCFVVGYVYTKIIFPNGNRKVFPEKTAGWIVTPQEICPVTQNIGPRKLPAGILSPLDTVSTTEMQTHERLSSKKTKLIENSTSESFHCFIFYSGTVSHYLHFLDYCGDKVSVSHFHRNNFLKGVFLKFWKLSAKHL